MGILESIDPIDLAAAGACLAGLLMLIGIAASVAAGRSRGSF